MKFNRAGSATWPLLALIAALLLAATSARQPALEFRRHSFVTGSAEVAEALQTPTATDTEAVPSATTEQPTDTEAAPSATPEEPTDTQPPPASPTGTPVPPTTPPPPTGTQPPSPSPASTATITPPPTATRGRPPASRTPSATATPSRTATPTRTWTRTATRTATTTGTLTPTPPVAAASPRPVETVPPPESGGLPPWVILGVGAVVALAALGGLAVLGGLAWLSSRRPPAVVTAGETYPISVVTTADDCNCTLTSVKFEEEEKEEKGKKTKQKKLKVKYNPAYKPPGVKGDADQIEFETKLLIEVATKGTGKVAYKITPTVQLFLYKLTWEELQEVQKLRWKRPRTEAEEKRLRELNKKMDLGLIDLKKSAPGEPLGGNLDCPFEGTIEQEIKGDIWWEGADYRIGTKDKPQVRSFMLYIKADVECGKDSRWTDIYWNAQVGWEKGQVKISNEQIT